jgi:hypothetical protein
MLSKSVISLLFDEGRAINIEDYVQQCRLHTIKTFYYFCEALGQQKENVFIPSSELREYIKDRVKNNHPNFEHKFNPEGWFGAEWTKWLQKKNSKYFRDEFTEILKRTDKTPYSYQIREEYIKTVRSILRLESKIQTERLIVNPDEGDNDYTYEQGDDRDITIRSIKARRGQQKFRKQLINIHSDRCMISGYQVRSVIEAAHIDPYRGESQNHPKNGLLLRSDLHTLFDLDLIGIEPESLTIEIHPSLEESEYERFKGNKILFDSKHQPDYEALNRRWKLFISSLEVKSE